MLGYRSMAFCALLAGAQPVSAQGTPNATKFSFTAIVDNATPRPDGQGNFNPDLGADSVPAINGDWVVFINDDSDEDQYLGIWSYNTRTKVFTELVNFTTAYPALNGGHFVGFGACGSTKGYAIQVQNNTVLFFGAVSNAPACGYGYEGGLYTVPAKGGTISKVVDWTTALPGMGGTFLWLGSGPFYLVSAFQMSLSNGTVVFSAGTQNPTDQGVWAASSNGTNLELIADETTQYCLQNQVGGCAYLYSNGFISDGSVAFTGGGTFGEEGWNGLFVTSSSSPALNPVLNSTQVLPGDTAPGGPIQSFYFEPVIDGSNMYFVATDPNFQGTCPGGSGFTGVFQTTLGGGTMTNVANTCDTLPGVGQINVANSFNSLSASGSLLVFQLEDNDLMVTGSVCSDRLYAAINGVPSGPVISCGDTLLGEEVYSLTNFPGSLSVSSDHFIFGASLGQAGGTYGIYMATSKR
jgi:hypothetical protein